jgi:hypothetical protein
MAIATGAALAFEILAEAVPALIKLIAELVDGSEADADAYRKRPITVSIAFGGGDGEAYKVQTVIEDSLPADPPDPDSTPTDPG